MSIGVGDEDVRGVNVVVIVIVIAIAIAIAIDVPTLVTL